MKIRDQGNVDQGNIIMSHIVLELTDRLQERLALNISGSTTYLDNGNLCILTSIITIETALDLIGDMRDNLYGASTVIAAAFLI